MQELGTRDLGLGKTPAPCPWYLAPVPKTSRRFLDNQQQLVYLAEVARRSQCRPSQLLELRGMPAYRLDCAAAEAQALNERQPAQEGNVMEW